MIGAMPLPNGTIRGALALSVRFEYALALPRIAIHEAIRPFLYPLVQVVEVADLQQGLPSLVSRDPLLQAKSLPPPLVAGWVRLTGFRE